MKLKTLLFLSSIITSISASDVIKGLNWFGFETEHKDLMCNWKHSIQWNIHKISELGFNTIRLPFCLQYVHEGNFDNMDLFFELARQEGIDVVLDFHRLYSTRQSEKPFDSIYSFDDFLCGWKTILERYKSFDNLVAVDIFNEYQSENFYEWNSIAKSTVVCIEEHFPNRFKYYVGGTNWGGNLFHVDLSSLSFHDRIVYSIHKYSFSDYFPYQEKWDYSFGSHQCSNVGEWGYMSNIPEQKKWAEDFVDYLIEKDKRDTFFWTWTYNSGDTGGILKEDCETVDEEKMKLLHKLWYS